MQLSIIYDESSRCTIWHLVSFFVKSRVSFNFDFLKSQFFQVLFGPPKLESAKLRALRAKNVLTCQRALRAYVPTCFACLRTHVSMCLVCLCGHVLTC